jgi:hypothetical protein
MSRLIKLLLGAALVAAAAVYVLDRRRRRKAESNAHAGAGHAAPPASYAANDAQGAVATATPSPQRLDDPGDGTVARRAETETEILHDAATDHAIKRVEDPLQAPATPAEPWGGVFERR